MTISDLGSLGEFIASFAVVVSVAYLGLQIRAQRAEQQRQNIRDLSNLWNDVGRSVAENKDLAQVYLSGIADYELLGPAEKVQFSHHVTRILKRYEELYFLQLEGSLAPEVWETAEFNLSMLAGRGLRQYWRGRERMYRPEFRALVGEMLGRHQSSLLEDLYRDS